MYFYILKPLFCALLRIMVTAVLILPTKLFFPDLFDSQQQNPVSHKQNKEMTHICQSLKKFQRKYFYEFINNNFTLGRKWKITVIFRRQEGTIEYSIPEKIICKFLKALLSYNSPRWHLRLCIICQDLLLFSNPVSFNLTEFSL